MPMIRADGALLQRNNMAAKSPCSTATFLHSRLLSSRHKNNTEMANIKANITELRPLLDITPAGHNLMLVGNHGISKSEISLTGQ